MPRYRDVAQYSNWVRTQDTLADGDRKAIRASIRGMDRSPLFSIILLPATEAGFSLASASVASIRSQLYPHLELWLPEVTTEIDMGSDCRLRPISASAADDVASKFNAALVKAEGDFVLPLPSDAIISETALYQMAVALIEHPAADVLYTDEDCVDANGERCTPYFKTDWDPDLALGRDAIGLLVAYSNGLMKRLGGMRPQANNVTMSLYDLSLRAVFAVPPHQIQHIAAVLCHRRVEAQPAPGWDVERAREIVGQRVTELDDHAAVVPAPLAPFWNRIVWSLPDPAPLVSIIIPTRDHAELLGPCTESVLSRTDYPALELLIVDNNTRELAAIELLRRLSQDPRVRVLPYRQPFNYSAQNNMAAREARGEVIVLLNNDTEAVGPEWLREMVSHAMRLDVGAVGAKLIYPDNRIQHAGMVLGPDIWSQHQLRFADRLDTGPFGELAVARTVSVVTGACIALRRAVFFEAGGLNEQLRENYNDVDLCLRIGDCGYRIVWTPFAELLHVESASRERYDTPERQAAAAQEAQYFWRFWRSLCHNDPFHNPNLVYGWHAVSLSWPPRRAPPWVR